MIRRILISLALVAALAAGCGDDDGSDVESPPVTNEFGVETFEPSDDPFFEPETDEPSAS
jgi:hypothetical protein